MFGAVVVLRRVGRWVVAFCALITVAAHAGLVVGWGSGDAMVFVCLCIEDLKEAVEYPVVSLFLG